MGDLPPHPVHLIPLSDTAKTKVDVATVVGTVLGFFKAIPWPEIAAFAAFIYTVLRIIELVWSWVKKK